MNPINIKYHHYQAARMAVMRRLSDRLQMNEGALHEIAEINEQINTLKIRRITAVETETQRVLNSITIN